MTEQLSARQTAGERQSFVNKTAQAARKRRERVLSQRIPRSAASIGSDFTFHFSLFTFH